MRPSTEQLDTFIAVVESGSFARAANLLGVSRSIVSRRIARMEELLSLRLFSRSTHIVAVTEGGRLLYERAKRAMSELDEAIDLLTGTASEVAGTVRISAPTTFGTKYLTPTVQQLMADFPRLNVDVILRDDGCYNPLLTGGDFSIFIGLLDDSSLVTRFFKPIQQVLVCSPSFAAKRSLPRSPADLARYECLICHSTSNAPQWQYHREDSVEAIRPNGRLLSNNPQVVCDAAVAGMGLALIPGFVASEALEDGRLVQAMATVKFRDLGLNAVFPPNPRFPRRVRTVIDFLAARWKKPLPTGHAPLVESVQCCIPPNGAHQDASRGLSTDFDSSVV